MGDCDRYRRASKGRTARFRAVARRDGLPPQLPPDGAGAGALEPKVARALSLAALLLCRGASCADRQSAVAGAGRPVEDEVETASTWPDRPSRIARPSAGMGAGPLLDVPGQHRRHHDHPHRQRRPARLNPSRMVSVADGGFASAANRAYPIGGGAHTSAPRSSETRSRRPPPRWRGHPDIARSREPLCPRSCRRSRWQR